MNGNINYRIDRTTISQQKMQFNVINRRPQYVTQDIESTKAEIEKQLFEVFLKYAHAN